MDTKHTLTNKSTVYITITKVLSKRAGQDRRWGEGMSAGLGDDIKEREMNVA